MKKYYLYGIIVGLVILFLAVPLGDFYGGQMLSFHGQLETDRYFMLIQSAIFSFQVIGGIISLLSGLAYIFKRDE